MSTEPDEPANGDDDDLPSVPLSAALVKAMDLAPGEELPEYPIPADDED